MMMTGVRWRGLAMAALALWSGAAVAADGVTIQTFRLAEPALPNGRVSFAGGRTLDLHAGIGSGAFHPAGAPAAQFVTVADRGPNFTCDDAKSITGVDGATLCGETRNGRIYPAPDYSPSIYRIEVGPETARVLQTIPLKDREGRAITGMPNPLTVATTENPLDAAGRPLAQSAAALDVEGIVEVADGSFWIGEENAPSFLHVAKDGTVLTRIVPAGTEPDFAAAAYEVKGLLPAILARRQANRGIESMALSPDGQFLFFVLQNPLANPDAAAFKQATNTRLFKVDITTAAPVAEYVYELTPMSQFKGEESKAPSTARISELLAVDAHRFLIDDRTDKTTLIFEIDLAGATDILGRSWDDPSTGPTLEQGKLAALGITPVTKRLVLDSSRYPDLPAKIEGMAFFGGTGAAPDLMLVNDDDFGIGGDHTIVARVSGLPIER